MLRPEVFLIIPVMSGYLFARHCYHTRLKIAKADGHGVYFWSVCYGLLFFCIASLVDFILRLIVDDAPNKLFIQLAPWLVENRNGNGLADFVFVCVVSFFVGLMALRLVNHIYDRNPGLKMRHFNLESEAAGDELGILLAKALEKGLPIQLVLDTRKAYIGFLTGACDPLVSRKWVTIIPLLSGYLDKDTLDLKFTIDYREIIYRLQTDDAMFDHLCVDDFILSIAFDRIVSARFFDTQAYEEIEKYRIAGANGSEQNS